MALFNYATKEITLKLVYYGPGLSGKTTNLHYLHGSLEPERRGKLLALSTETDRTLFFDFLPVTLGKIKDFSIRFQLYTVPGQVRYDATRRLVLKGADAVIFVADSQREMKEQNIESFENMINNLAANNIDPNSIPLVIQFNKRDLPNLLSIEELNLDLNKGRYGYVLAEAINGTGVEETFRKITAILLKDISKRHNVDIVSLPEAGPESRPAEEASAPPQEEAEEAVGVPASEAPEFEIERDFGLEEPPPEVHKETPVPEEALDITLEESGPSEETSDFDLGTHLVEEGEAGEVNEDKEAPAEQQVAPEAIKKISKQMQELARTVEKLDISRLEREHAEEGEPFAPYSAEKVEIMFNSIIDLSGNISKAVSDAVKELRDLKTDVGTLYSLKNTVSELMKEIEEFRKGQGEILNALREVLNARQPDSARPAKKKGLFDTFKK